MVFKSVSAGVVLCNATVRAITFSTTQLSYLPTLMHWCVCVCVFVRVGLQMSGTHL